jgi:predicted amidophosphoribosyltransferase
MGPVCDGCYKKIRAEPSTCPQCGHGRPLIAISEDGDRVCGPCVGFTFNSACSQCGTTADLYEHDRCARCVMIARVRDLLTGADGQVPLALRKLAEAFESVDNPKSVIKWLRHSSGARLLAQLAAGETEITHAALDALPQTRISD